MITSAFKNSRSEETGGRPPRDPTRAFTGGLGIRSIRATSASNSDDCGTMDVPALFGLTPP
jgi:hypothetical protein